MAKNRIPLLSEQVLDRFRTEQERVVGIKEGDQARSWIKYWTRENIAQKWTELELEQKFNQKFFSTILGYSLGPRDDTWNAWPKPSTQHTGLSKKPDLLLGNFSTEDSPINPIAVVELKKPGTSLDAPQPQYDNKTPVEQGFEYAENLPPTRWVIVSDMISIRLYGVDDINRYHDFDLNDCISVLGQNLTNEFEDLYFLLHRESLVEGGTDSKVSRLIQTTSRKQRSFQEGFYDVYSQIRLDLLEAISNWLEENGIDYNKKDSIEAVQRLLDRMIFIYFCEDHPEKLLPKSNLVKNVVDSAIYHTPGPSKCKAYEALKQLFRDIDQGAKAAEWEIPRYNGELFKYHPIVDEVEIPDKLAKKSYQPSDRLESRTIDGVWGLYEFDFWRELDRDLLGNIFEKSITDLAMLSENDEEVSIAESLQKQRDWGVYYTRKNLAKFVASSVVKECLNENSVIQANLAELPEIDKTDKLKERVEGILNEIMDLDIIDPACGSGVFLTAALDELLQIYQKSTEVQPQKDREAIFWEGARSRFVDQSEVAKSVIHGVDLLPQAVELSKLSVWLMTAKKKELSSNLSNNFFANDSLCPQIQNKLTKLSSDGFDIVMGNPPWGGKYDSDLGSELIDRVGLDPTEEWDSWEVFIMLAYTFLKQGGRIGLILPDTIHSPEKKRIRNFLLENFSIEKMYNMGPDWFGSEIRMGAVVLQARKKEPSESHQFKGLVLAGELRRKTINGEIPLRQIESKLQNSILQKRARESDSKEIRVFCSERDYGIMDKMVENSVELGGKTNRARGEEMNREGLFWQCPNCNGYTVPGSKDSETGKRSKNCPFCDFEMTENEVENILVVNESETEKYSEPYIDGQILNHRYENLEPKWINTNVSPIQPKFKDKEIYNPPKIFIRQAGVGITATISYNWTRCPQSVYIYRCNEEANMEGYTEEFILASLVSRTMNYFILKRFGEIDPARAHTKLTHTRLKGLPIPFLETESEKQIASKITENVQEMVEGEAMGSEIDYDAEILLRKLWGLNSEEGAFINRTFSVIPESQTITDLFPEGPPKMVEN